MNILRASAVLLVLPLLAVAGLDCPAAAQTSPPPSKAQPVVLFVQPASAMTFKDGVLTLKNVPQNTYFFSDRPDRITGQVRNDLFVKYWNGEDANSLKNDPPNAALAVGSAQGRPTGAIVVLSNPRVQGDDMLYDARTLTGDIPVEAGQTVLFIDDAVAPCWPGYREDVSGYPCWAQAAFSR